MVAEHPKMAKICTIQDPQSSSKTCLTITTDCTNRLFECQWCVQSLLILRVFVLYFVFFHKHKKYNTHFNFWNILSLCLLHIRKKTQSNMQSMVNSKARVSEVLSARSTSHFYSFIITQYNQNVAKGVRDPCLECFLSKVSFWFEMLTINTKWGTSDKMEICKRHRQTKPHICRGVACSRDDNGFSNCR